MLSRVRIGLEIVLRGLALAALAGLIAHAFHVRGNPPADRAEGADVAGALVRWSTREAPARVHVELDAAPTPVTRDWLAALERAGTDVAWGGAAPAPTALVVEPVPDPDRATRVWLAAPAGTRALLEDGFGALDSVAVAAAGAGAVVRVPDLTGTLRAGTDRGSSSAALRDSLVLRPVLVLAQAGWEAKFTMAALEERGWEVEARLAVRPDGDARQGAANLAIDTSRYAAVVALDSVASRYAGAIARYVRDGGGLIAVGPGAALGSLDGVLPASITDAASAAGPFSADSAATDPRSALALAPLGRLDSGAVVLETRPSAERETIAAVAHRVGQGRVLQVGYQDTWRWRLGGSEDDPPAAHREWWAALVSSVAFTPRVPLRVDGPLDPTPLASLVASLGSPSPRPPLAAGLLGDPRLAAALFGLLLVALFFEWLSRRLRGAR